MIFGAQLEVNKAALLMYMLATSRGRPKFLSPLLKDAQLLPVHTRLTSTCCISKVPQFKRSDFVCRHSADGRPKLPAKKVNSGCLPLAAGGSAYQANQKVSQNHCQEDHF